MLPYSKKMYKILKLFYNFISKILLMKKIFFVACMLVVFFVNAQTGTWLKLVDNTTSSTFFPLNSSSKIIADSNNQIFATTSTGCFGNAVIKYKDGIWSLTQVGGCDNTYVTPFQKDSLGNVYTLFYKPSPAGTDGWVYKLKGDSAKVFDTVRTSNPPPYNGTTKFTVTKNGKAFIVKENVYTMFGSYYTRVYEWNTTTNNWIHLRGTGNDTIAYSSSIAYITTDRNNNPIVSIVRNSTNHLLMWNGTAWVDLSANADYYNTVNPISTIVKANNGDLYAKGNLQSNGSEFRAKWNYSTLQWEAVPTTDIYNDVCINFDNIVYDNLGNAYGINICTNNVAKWNGTSWQQLGNISTLSLSGTISNITTDNLGNVYVGNLTDASGKYAVAKYELVMPIKLISFTATKNKNIALVKWQTATEINTSHFNILKSYNGRSFELAGKVNAKGAGEYIFENLLTTNDYYNTTIYYQLEIVDKDGKKTYSEIKSFSIDGKNNWVKIFPNPAETHLFVSCIDAAEIAIIDYKGSLVYKCNTNSAINKIELQNFKKGIYIVKIITTKGETNAVSFIKN